jgi:hypothetical protein
MFAIGRTATIATNQQTAASIIASNQQFYRRGDFGYLVLIAILVLRLHAALLHLKASSSCLILPLLRG